MSTTVESEFVLTEEFERALAILESGDNLFLTGKAGTGKSTLIRHFLEDCGDRRVLVAAPTGIAALNVGGYTIHRLFSFLATTTLDDVRQGGYKPQRFAKALRSLQTLIIDEASMVRADLFDMLVAALERFGPRPGTRFGGVQIVLVGDLLQLPPVVTTGESEYFSTRYDTPYFFSADTFRREDFPTVALTTVFRQLGDQRLTSILNAVREGVLLESAQHDLNARTDPDFVPPDDEFWLTLAPTNAIVTARNRQRLERLDGQEVTHFAERLGDLSLFDAAADDKLTFKVGAQIMMLSNDQSERWVNGTLGRIIAITHRETGLVATVEFRDGSVADVGAHTWEATRPVVEGGALRHEVIGSYAQLPFKLAWAITIHKSQGQTLDRLVVDLSGGAFDFGQVYVALSRCTSMDGLVLTRPVRPKDLRTDRRILRFLRDGGPGGEVRRHCAIGMVTVGDEGRLSRPRPVEIAVAFDDGASISTLINPQRDLAGAREAYGIAVDDVLLAPTLAEAWTVLGPVLEGTTPVGVSTDHALGLIDFEFKRLGRVMPLPMGIDVRPQDLLADERQGMLAASALERAHAALAAHTRLAVQDGGASAFAAYDATDAGSAYLLTRDPTAVPPSSVHLPVLSALLDISREISSVLLSGMSALEVRASIRPVTDGPHEASLRSLAAERLKIVASRSTGVPSGLLDRFSEVGILLGIETSGLLDAFTSPASAIAEVLVPGARVCFTGEARSPSGRMLDREDMETLAADCGLIPVKNVTKTKCEALVVAEVGTQSGKARKAVDYGKPVFSAEEFFTWATTSRPDKMSAFVGL
ncbi:AAA family ATPase [Aeromicrobium sp. P5_D10]